MFAGLAALVLSSCLTIEEHLTLERDGSGTYVTTIDLSEMLSSPFLKMALEEQMSEGGEEVPTRVDSIIDIYGELAPLNPQWTTEEKALLQRVESRMVMDLENNEGEVFIKYPFGNMDELQLMMDLMAEANQPEEGDDDANPFSGLGGGMMSGAQNTFSWKKGNFGRETVIPDEISEELGVDEDTKGMMEMMFADAKVVYIMEFPGKVKKVSGFPGHTQEGNNILRQEFSFLDLINDPATIDAGLDGQVKYKK